MTIQRHSPFAIGIGIAVLAFSPGLFLAGAQSFAPTQFSPVSEDQGQIQYRQCMLQALNGRETIRLQTYQQYNTAHIQAYQQRWQQMQQAWQIADTRTRNNALRDIDRGFTTLERDLGRARTAMIRDADRGYTTARRACDDQYRQWKRDRTQANRATSRGQTVDYSTYPSFGGSTYGQQYDPYRQTGTYGQTSTYYDQTSYYDSLLRQSQQQQYSYPTSSTWTYGAQQNIRCGDGICQAGELNVCSADCVAYPQRADDTWTSRYVYGQGWVEPVQY